MLFGSLIILVPWNCSRFGSVTHTSYQLTSAWHRFLFKIYFSLIYLISTAASPPSSSSSTSPFSLPKIHFSSEKGRLPGISIKHGIPSSNKSRHILSYQLWTMVPSKRLPKGDKRIRCTPTPTIRSPTRMPSYTTFMQRT